MAKKFYQDCQAGDLDAVEKFLSSENVNGNKINELVFDDGLGFKATPLHAAVESGNNQLVRTLLQHGGNPSIQDGQKYTCLMLACSLGKIDIVRVLMDHGVEIIPSKSSGLKSTPLHEAVMANNVEIVETLLSVEPKLLELTDNRKWTALHFACQYGKPEVAKVLMEKGANIDAQIDIRRTPLHLAAFEGYPECIEHLLEKGADPNIQSEGNWTPLILAAQEGKTRCAELLLGDPRININLRASNGRNALHSASFYGRVEIAQMLIDKGIECHVPDKDKWTQLHLCCQEKHPDIVKCILNSGKMVDINAKSHNGRTPLHSAALKGSSEAVRLLIDSGAKVDEADNKDWTPLHVACQHGHTAVVEILIRAGADPNKLISMGRNALHLAAFEGRVQIAEMLLENSVKVHVPDKDLWTPLHLATQEGKTPIALMILKRREANINAQAHNGRTPLHSAAFYGRKDLVKALLDHGANTYVQDEKGWSQLHLAAQEGHLEIVEMLVTMGAPVNAQSDNLRTPIHLACMRSHTQIVSYLITHSADLSLKDSKQWTCLHVAYHHKRQEVFRILLEHGIPVNAQTDEGRTCLHMLCSHYDGSHYYIEQLLKHNANIGIKDKDGNTPLHLAAASNAPDIVDRLLQKAADVESENYSGMRPLSLGIGHINIVRKLIESGADVGACDKQGMTALHQACAKQSINVSVVQELLKCDKALVNRLTNAGSSPLHLACQSNNKKQVVQYLLDNGANVDEANTEGYTPVLYAARYGSAEVVKSLIAAKADHKARTKKGETALHMACYGGNVDIVRTILDLSIPINACDFEKRSALLVASSRGHTGVVSVLLEKKANTSLVTGGGQNALHIASEKHHRSVCELLIKAGVNIKVHMLYCFILFDSIIYMMCCFSHRQRTARVLLLYTLQQNWDSVILLKT